MNKLLSAITFLLLTNLVFAQYDTTIISEKHNKRFVKVLSNGVSSYFTMRLNREGKYVIDGKCTDYFEFVTYISHYKNGELNGSRKIYSANGRLDGKSHFKNGELNGKTVRCYFDREKGKNYFEFKGYFRLGQKCGKWEYYDLQFNYVVKGKFARKTIYTSYVNETVQFTNSYSSDTLIFKIHSEESLEYCQQFGYPFYLRYIDLRKGKWIFYQNRKKLAVQHYSKDGIKLSEEFFEGYDEEKLFEDFWFLTDD